MKFPIQILLRHMESSAALEAHIRTLASRFDRFSAHVMRCQVTVEAPHQHRRQANLYSVQIDITVPDAQICVGHAHRDDHAHEDAYIALRDAFRAARRKLQDYERQRRGEVKTHAELPIG